MAKERNFPMTFDGKRLAAARHKKGLTQHELGNLCRYTERQISAAETGHSVPQAETLACLAKVLNVSTDYLLGLCDSPLPPTALLTAHQRRILDMFAEFNESELEAIRTTFRLLKQTGGGEDVHH